jgi:hypothetical protein
MSKVIFTITDIEYDFDTDDDVSDLPTDITLEVDLGVHSDRDEITELLSDHIDAETGYCCKGFAVTPNIEEALKIMGYTLETAIRGALTHAKEKAEKGFLYKFIDEEIEKAHDWSKGDPETVHTLALLYADDVNNVDDTWEEEILKALEKEFPEHF